jgi:nucleoside-diphosphate-sugar epimerase
MMDLKNNDHVLITGGAGYIGSALTGALLRRGFWVTVVDKLLFGGEALLHYFSRPRFHFVHGDVCENGAAAKAAREAARKGAPPIRYIVHLAAIVGFPACKRMAERDVRRHNVEAVKLVYGDADELGVDRFIFASTYSNYGRAMEGKLVDEESPLQPQSLYAETKIEAENFLINSAQESDCAPLIFRFATLFGPSARMRFDLIVNQFVLEAFSHGELLIYEGNYSRSFVHIQDVIAGILLGIEAPLEKIRGQTFNLGSKAGNYTKEEIVSLIQKALPQTKVRYQDLSFGGDMRDIQVSFEKIGRVLGFRANRSVEGGIQEVVSLLQSGLIEDPFAERYRNAPAIIS